MCEYNLFAINVLIIRLFDMCVLIIRLFFYVFSYNLCACYVRFYD